MISIIIPAYNSAATIVEALESVLAQTVWSGEGDGEKESRVQNSGDRIQEAEGGEGEVSLGSLGEGAGSGTSQHPLPDSPIPPFHHSTIPPFDHSTIPPFHHSPSPFTSHSSLPYEVLIIDDCSKDNTVEVVQNWIEEKTSPFTHHVSLLTLPQNSGPAAARNAGITAAKGEWIAFLDADDLWTPSHVETLLAVAHETGALMVCGESVRFQDGEEKAQAPGPQTLGEEKKSEQKTAKCAKDEGNCISAEGGAEGSSLRSSCASVQDPPITQHSLVTPHFSPITLHELARHNPIATSAVMVKREAVLAAGGFDEQFRGPEDYDLWIRVATLRRQGENIIEQKDAKNAKGEGGRTSCISYVNIPVSSYRQTTGSLSMDERKFLPQVLRVIEKAYHPGGALSGFPRWKHAALATQYQQASWMAFCRGDRMTALKDLAIAIRHNVVSSRRIQKPWLGLAYRYLVGRRGT